MAVLNLGPELALPIDEVVGQCVAILGIRGSGKSNTAGVIFEELLSNHYPLSIVDTDGEYYGLKEKFEVLVVGGDHGDAEVDPALAPRVAELSLREGVPVILDVSALLPAEREIFIQAYLERLWTLAGDLRQPYMIGIEECHEFIPQGRHSQLKDLVTRIALRGRKRGLGAVIISQRSAKVEKDVLTQAGLLFLHRVVHEADMRVYTDLLPWRRHEVKEVVTHLAPGECIFLSGDSAQKTKIRLRYTFHGGYTPSFNPVESPRLRRLRSQIHQATPQDPQGSLAPEASQVDGSPSAPPLALPQGGSGPEAGWLSHLERRLRRFPPEELKVLGFLAAREDREYTMGEVAFWTGLAEPYLRLALARRLQDRGLIRLCQNGETTMRLSLEEFATRVLPGCPAQIDPSILSELLRQFRQMVARFFPSST